MGLADKEPESGPRILIARTDRIGDLVLSLPVISSIKSAWPGAWIAVLAREYTRPLLSGRDDIDEVIAFDSGSAHIPPGDFPDVVKRIRKGKFDISIALYLNFSVGLALFLAGIPRRIGPATKVAQFLLTDRVKQRRSKGGRHEADHNLDLLNPLDIPGIRKSSIEIPDSAPKIFQKSADRPLACLHPGHGGSSRNWPETYYSEMIGKLTASGFDVAVTGGGEERELVERVIGISGVRTQSYIGGEDLMELACALSQCDVFIASSTGPLHIASAVGTPVVGLYCPIKVCLPERWGPIGDSDVTFTPDVESCERCVGESCLHYDCMESISVDEVHDKILGMLRRPVSR